MDVKFVIAITALATITIGQPISDQVQIATNQNVIPGIFIPADVLKELQEKADQNRNDNVNQPISKQNIAESTEIPPLVNQPDNMNIQDLALKINQINQAKLLAEQNQQSRLASQQPEIANQQLAPLNQQPAPFNQQPAPLNQQQVIANQQPKWINQQPELASEQPNLANQQPVLLNQQIYPNRQPILSNQQQFLTQQSIPNQQSFILTQQQGLPNQQAILVSQQPRFPNQQLLLLNNNQPTQGTVPQNGQFMQYRPSNSQPISYTSNPMNNQAPLVKSINITPIQNPGTTLYAVVPVNSQNPTPMGNGNSYLMPVQQMTNPNTMYSVNSGK